MTAYICTRPCNWALASFTFHFFSFELTNKLNTYISPNIRLIKKIVITRYSVFVIDVRIQTTNQMITEKLVIIRDAKEMWSVISGKYSHNVLSGTVYICTRPCNWALASFTFHFFSFELTNKLNTYISPNIRLIKKIVITRYSVFVIDVRIQTTNQMITEKLVIIRDAKEMWSVISGKYSRIVLSVTAYICTRPWHWALASFHFFFFEWTNKLNAYISPNIKLINLISKRCTYNQSFTPEGYDSCTRICNGGSNRVPCDYQFEASSTRLWIGYFFLSKKVQTDMLFFGF